MFYRINCIILTQICNCDKLNFSQRPFCYTSMLITLYILIISRDSVQPNSVNFVIIHRTANQTKFRVFFFWWCPINFFKSVSWDGFFLIIWCLQQSWKLRLGLFRKKVGTLEKFPNIYFTFFITYGWIFFIELNWKVFFFVFEI